VGSIVVLAAASPSGAAPILRLEQGSNVVTVTDTDGDGIVAFFGSVGTYKLNLTFGSDGTISGGSSDYALLDLISGDATATGGTLTITLADTDYALPVSSGSAIVADVDVKGTLVAPSGGSVSFQSWINQENLSPLPSSPTTIPLYSDPLYTPIASVTKAAWECYTCNFSANDSTALTYTGGPFALFSQAIISLNGAGGVVFNQGIEVHATSVPEPASALLFGTGLLAAFGVLRRRRRQSTPLRTL
jgi:hypothetical protein